MPYFNIVAETNENTVVTEYEPVKKRSDAYQSEAELEQEFIRLLCEQGYEYLPIHTEEDLIQNLRTRLEDLNDYKFSDTEWERFFTEKIANKNEGIVDKTRKIQEDSVQVLKRDDAMSKNIMLIDKKQVHKIDIAESIKTQSMLRKQLICTYDEFSVNSTMNRIIKSTVALLLRSNISKQRKKNLRKLMMYFGEVDFIDLHTVNWNVQYNRNNQTYRMLISVCYLVVKGLLQTQSDGSTQLMDFLDEQRMCRLYEKFILEYYRKEYKNQITANASQIPWQLDNEENTMLPVMQSDIMLQHDNRVLIIDAKYYEHSTQVQFDKHTLHSNNLYQIFTYVKNKEYELREKDHTVSGMLLYAKTDEEIYPNNVYQMSGNQITVRTLDLNLPFDEIAGQLNTIAKTHFDL